MARETVIDRLVTELLFREDKAALDRINRGVERARKNLRALSTGFIATGTALTGMATVSLNEFRKFERTIEDMEGQVGIAKAQLDDWKPKILEVSKAYGILPAAAADAMWDITSAGFRGAEAMDMLEAAAMASAAGFGDIKMLADLMTSSMNAYKGELTAIQSMDTLAQGVKLGKATPEAFAESLGQALPMASALGVKFNELLGIMAAMSRTGSKPNEAVTQINAILMELFKTPTKETEEALQSLGLEINHLRDIAESEGLTKALATINNAVKDTGGNFKRQVPILFRQSRAMKGVFDLFGGNSAENMAIIEGMKNTEGATKQAFIAITDTLDFALSQLKARWKAFNTEVGGEMKGTAQIVVDAIHGIFNWIDSFGKAGKRLIAQVMSFGPVLLGLGIGLRVLAFALSPLVRGALLLATAFKVLGVAVLWLGRAMLMNPFGLMITAIAGVVAAGIWLTTNWETVKEWFANFFDWMADRLGGKAVQAIVGFAKTIYDIFGAAFDWLSEKWAWVTDKFSAVARFFGLGGGAGAAATGGSALQLPGVTAPLTPAPALVQNQQQAVTKTANVQIDSIVVPGANAAEVAENLPGELARQAEALADSVDNHFGA